MTPDKSFRCGHGQGHVTTTTVPCKLQQWDRYRVPQNVFNSCFKIKYFTMFKLTFNAAKYQYVNQYALT